MDQSKRNILYDVCSFAMLGLGVANILYCLFLKLENYNYYIIASIAIISVLLSVISLKLDCTEETYFNRMVEGITIKNLKEFGLNFFNLTMLLFSFLLFLYPLSEFILWVLSTIFPKLWSDTYSVNWITDFAIKYLPYSFHPNCGTFSFFMVNLICFLVAAKIIGDEHIYIGGCLGAVLLYSFFDEQFFDKFADIAELIGIFAIFGVIAYGIITGAGNSTVPITKNTNNSNQAHKLEQRKQNVLIKNDQNSTKKSCEKSSTQNTQKQNNKAEILEAYQHGKNVVVLGENKRHLFPDKSGILMGWTSSSVTIKKGRYIYTYDTKGHQISGHQVDF